MDIIIDKINKLFIKTSEWKNKTGVKMRNKKLSIREIVKYRFLYSQINKTKLEIVSHLNFLNGLNVNRSSYEKKSKNCSVELYENILNGVKEIYNDNFKVFGIHIISVDGTFNNTYKSDKSIDTNLNMAYFDVSSDVPIDVQFKGNETKNTELQQFKDYIESNNLRDVIIVADRAYFKYEFFDFLDKRNIKYVIRIKSNSQLLESNVITKYNKNKTLIENLKKNNRIIQYEFNNEIKLTNKKNETIKVTKTNNYSLLTNLKNNNKYTDDVIKNIYNSRWNIELFFRQLKKEFKFSCLMGNENEFKKTYLINLIVIYLSKIIKQCYISFKKSQLKETSFKINESNIIKGIYSDLLNDIVNGTLTHEIFDKFLNNYIVVFKNKTGRHFPRMCKCPFKKWYIKSYLEIYKYNKIKIKQDANKTNELDKNLKLISNNVKIIVENKINVNKNIKILSNDTKNNLISGKIN
jgi:hypothetical protein